MRSNNCNIRSSSYNSCGSNSILVVVIVVLVVAAAAAAAAVVVVVGSNGPTVRLFNMT